jgi:hypothetical protein
MDRRAQDVNQAGEGSKDAPPFPAFAFSHPKRPRPHGRATDDPDPETSMRSLWRGAVPLLAAAALGLARPTTAPCSSPPPAAPKTVVAAEPEDEVEDLPRVVAPHRLVLEPLKTPSNPGTPAAVVPAAATATPATVDLLAPPSAPAGWFSKAVQVKVPIAPSGLPSAPTSVAAAAPKAQKIAAPAQAAPAPSSERHAAAHAWPAAFVTAADADIAESPPPVRQAVHVEPIADAAGPSASAAPAPIYLNRLKERVASVCGGAAAGVNVEAKRNGGVFVKVRVHDAVTDQAMAEKIMHIPEMTAPNVHLLMEVER